MVTDLTTEELAAKVDKGVEWLSARSQTGFYLHFLAAKGRGLAIKPPKNWDAAKIAAYAEWASALTYWNELYALLEKRTETAA